MAERIALTRRADWGTAHVRPGTVADRIQEVTSPLPPDPRATHALRIKLLDGDYSQHIPSEQGRNERSQLQGPSARNGFSLAPLNAERWYEFSLGIEVLAAGPIDWHLLVQLHSSGSQPAAPFNLGVDGDAFTLIRHTPRDFAHIYGGRRPSDEGIPAIYHHFRLGWFLSTSGNGWIRAYRDEELIYERLNVQTSQDGTPNYPVIGFYRGAGVTGPDQALFEGFRVHDSLPPFAYTSAPPPPPPPPPPPVDTTPPVIVLTSPGATVSGTIPSFAVTTSEPVTSMKWTLTGPNVMQVLLTEANLPWGDFAFDTTDYPDGAYTLKAEGADAAGNVGSDTVGFEIDNVATPPPPPPPGPCAEIIAERDELRRLLDASEANAGMAWATAQRNQATIDHIRAGIPPLLVAYRSDAEARLDQLAGEVAAALLAPPALHE